MINSYSEEREIIETYFKEKWAKAAPVLFENSKQIPPKTGAYVRFLILDGTSEQASIGKTQLHRSQGMVQVQIFAKKGTGKAKVLELCDMVENIFSTTQLDSIQFRSAYTIQIGEVDQYWQANVLCPFYRNRIILT